MMAPARAPASACALLLLTGCAGADLPPASQAAPPRRADPALASPTPAPSATELPADPTAAPRATHDDGRLASSYGGRRALKVLRGQATYYGDVFAGHRTASGEPFDPDAFTAAHRTLPFGTIVRVVCPSSRRVVYVTINDRGPFGSRRRIIDLSRAAAERLDILRMGVADVRVEVVEFGRKKRKARR